MSRFLTSPCGLKQGTSLRLATDDLWKSEEEEQEQEEEEEEKEEEAQVAD